MDSHKNMDNNVPETQLTQEVDPSPVFRAGHWTQPAPSQSSMFEDPE